MEMWREGDAGARIGEMKARLDALGYDCGAGDAFDRQTAWAIRWFRRQNGLADGECADGGLLARLDSDGAVRGVPGEFAYYSMEDPLWADYPYDAANTPEIERMKDSACGPTSMAIAVSSLLRRAVLPPVLADWSNAHGFRDPDGIHGTSDAFFPACAERYGLFAERVEITGPESFARAEAELAAGHAIICNVVPGSPFTPNGHYNLIQRIENGRIHICDPNPKNASLPDYTIGEWLDGRWGRRYEIIGRR